MTNNQKTDYSQISQKDARYDRLLSLKQLHTYPSSEIADMTFYLPVCDKFKLRVWLLIPQGKPIISFDDVKLKPVKTYEGDYRWIDYGLAKLELPELTWGFMQLRISGIDKQVCAKSHLLVTRNLNFTSSGCSLEQAERKLWKLARSDAGSTSILPCRTQVGSSETFVVRYTAGSKGLPEGAQIRFTVPKTQVSYPQNTNPNAPGWTHIVNSDSKVSITEIGISPESHEAVDIICRLDKSFKPNQGFELSYYMERAFLCPHTFRQVDRLYWYSEIPMLSAAASVSRYHPFVSLSESNSHSSEFFSGPAERLHLFLPGRRFCGENLSVKGLFTDRYRNLPVENNMDRDIKLWLLSDNNKILLGTPAGHFTSEFTFEVPLGKLAPGVYRVIALHKKTGKQILISNPIEIIEENSSRHSVYWGEIHGHTNMSDGTGDLKELYNHAKNAACLDFAAAADHSEYFSDTQWSMIQDITNACNEPQKFVTLVGYEWGMAHNGCDSHRNVYTSEDGLKLFRGLYKPTSNLNVVWDYFHDNKNVVGGPHGSLAHGILWKHHDPSVERFIEIYSMWGASDTRDNPLVPDWAKKKPTGMTTNEILLTGAKLGFTGGGDCHTGHVGFSPQDPAGEGITSLGFISVTRYTCGLTAVVMPELTRKSLIKAIRQRHTYATTGARILLDFNISGLEMGSVGKVSKAECDIKVHGVDCIKKVEVIKDGDVVWSTCPDTLDVRLLWKDPNKPSKEHYYYLRVTQSDGQMAWSSPIWVNP